jgi:probable F420-dependent oxidoreductase
MNGNGGPLQIGVFLTHANDLIGSLAGLTSVARRLEDAGVDYVVVADHVVLGADLSAHAALGTSPLGHLSDAPYPDPLITLAAIAAVTSRIRLMTGVLIVPLRPAALLAKSVSTLASLSGGRLDFGVGSGWQETEFAALGVPMTERLSRLDEGLAACRKLWHDAPASFAAPSVSFDDVYCFPQPPGGDVPVWFAGQPIAATLRRVARGGSGWISIRPLETHEAGHIRADLDRACEEAGRGPGSAGIRCPIAGPGSEADGWKLLRDRVGELHASGVDGVHLPLRRLAHTMSEFDDLLPKIAALAC